MALSKRHWWRGSTGVVDSRSFFELLEGRETGTTTPALRATDGAFPRRGAFEGSTSDLFFLIHSCAGI